MYDYGYYDTTSTAATGGALAFLGAYTIVVWLVAIFMLVCMWKIFKKAGKKGWESIIPIYNIIVLLEITELPIWYLILFIIPIANIYAIFKIYIELAHKFGKSTGFGVGMVFLGIIFLPMLAFGKTNYNSTAAPVPETVAQQIPVPNTDSAAGSIPIPTPEPQQPTEQTPIANPLPTQDVQPAAPVETLEPQTINNNPQN